MDIKNVMLDLGAYSVNDSVRVAIVDYEDGERYVRGRYDIQEVVMDDDGKPILVINAHLRPFA